MHMDSDGERIVKAARELFNTRGYKSVTLDDLADELRMSKRTIYQHFDSKVDIATMVIDRVLRRVTEAFDQVVPGPDPLTDLRLLLNKVKGVVSAVSPLFQEDIRKLLPQLHDRIRSMRSDNIRKIEALIRLAQQRGLVRPSLDAHLATMVFLGAVEGFDRSELAAQGLSKMAAIDTVIDIFLSGIAVDGSGGYCGMDHP